MRRPRAGWRVFIQGASFLLLIAVVERIQDLALSRHSGLVALGGSLVYLAGTGVMVWAFARFIDHRGPAAYGFHLYGAWWADFGVGCLLGAATLTSVFVIERQMGWLQVISTCASPFLLPCPVVGLLMLVYLLAVAVGEEFTFRGYQMRNLVEGLSGGRSARRASVIALLITSMTFGLAHMLNPNLTVMAGVNIVLAGGLLGLGYLLTGEMAFPIGLHLAWGYFEEFVFGFPNSGQPPSSRLIGSEVTGPAVWTGGAFGPEGGLLVTCLILVDVFLLAGWILLRRRWQGVRGEPDAGGRGSGIVA